MSWNMTAREADFQQKYIDARYTLFTSQPMSPRCEVFHDWRELNMGSDVDWDSLNSITEGLKNLKVNLPEAIKLSWIVYDKWQDIVYSVLALMDGDLSDPDILYEAGYRDGMLCKPALHDLREYAMGWYDGYGDLTEESVSDILPELTTREA